MLSRSRSVLYCFSPLVMFVTAVCELGLAVYAYWRYRHTVIGQVTTFVLLFLGLFQVAEYNICEGIVSQNLFWTKLGLASITMLPPVGLHLVELIANKKRFWWISYLVGLIYIVLFVASGSLVQGGTCEGNYIIIHMDSLAYGWYYFGFLFLAIFVGMSSLIHDGLKASHRVAMQWLILGYISFMLPMGVVYVLEPTTRDAIPSIMCGFALLLAFILAGRVLPSYHRE